MKKLIKKIKSFFKPKPKPKQGHYRDYLRLVDGRYEIHHMFSKGRETSCMSIELVQDFEAVRKRYMELEGQLY